MPRYTFKGVAFVSGVTITVDAPTLGEAVGILARDEASEVDLDSGEIEYSWADLNSGSEKPKT